MINRHRIFLREIIANYFGATEEELCKIGDITSKTFKSDIQILDKALSKYKLCLYTKDNRYYIPFEQKESYLNAYEELIKEDDEQVLALENTERKIQILIHLCKSNDYLSMNLLADKLFVSKTSISSLIHELETEIPQKVKGTELKISSRKGIKLHASEKQRRELLVRFFSLDDNLAMNNHYLMLYLEKENKEKIEQVQDILIEFLKENQFEIANDNLNKLIMHMMIIIQRVKHAMHLDEKDYQFLPLYNSLSEKLSNIGIDISSFDLSSLPLNRLNRAIIIHPIVNVIIEEFVRSINSEFNTTIINIEDTKSLAAHIDDLLNRENKSYVKKEFVYDQMLQRLLSAYLLCGKLCKIIRDYTGIEIDEENRFYMAMHIQWLYRKNLVIHERMLLYDSNISECEMIKIDLEKHFGSKATIEAVQVRWDINQKINQNDYAIILSTKSLLDSFNQVPFLKIHSFLTNDDYDLIDKIVYKNKNVKILDAEFHKGCMLYGDELIVLDHDWIEIHDFRLTYVISDKIETSVYKMKESNRTVFVFNYNYNTPFLKYHRMINSFGQMIKENKIVCS